MTASLSSLKENIARTGLGQLLPHRPPLPPPAHLPQYINVQDIHHLPCPGQWPCFLFFLDAIIISWYQIPLFLFDGIDKILLKIKCHILYCVVLHTCCMKHDRGKQNCSAKRISRHIGNFWKLLIGINVRCTFNASLNCTKQMTKTIDKHCQRHNGPKSWMFWLVKAIVSTTKTRYTLLTP